MTLLRPPDRKSFQNDLSRYNNLINKCKNRLFVLYGKNDESGLIQKESESRRAIKRERELLAKDTEAVKLKMIDIKKNIHDQRMLINDLEKDMRFRRADKIDRFLEMYEKQYQKGNLTIREEQNVVNEINILKRNRAKLEKYDEALAERRRLEAEVDTMRKTNEAAYLNIRRLREHQNAADNRRRELVKEAIRLRGEMTEYHMERQQLVENYECARDDFTQWRKKEGKHSAGPATYPSANGYEDTEEEELEPFFEQKRDCRRIIAYLERLICRAQPLQIDCSAGAGSDTVQASPVSSTCGSPPVHHVPSSDSDSADELPPAFARLGVQCRPIGGHGHCHKPRTRRNSTRAAQPISHAFEYYNLFGQLELDAPRTLNEVPPTLDKVRDLLSHHEQQTLVTDWSAEMRGLVGDQLITISRSVSEFTGDSGHWVDSASASESTHSNVRFTHSPLPPNLHSPTS